MISPEGKSLHLLDTNNPKEIIIQGLLMKIEALGELRVPFDVTTDYPSRETYEHDERVSRKIKRRVVVKRIQNTVKSYAIGQNVFSNFDAENLYEENIQGYVDLYHIEISVWSPDSKDRDNLVELIKLWMLELEQEFQSGEITFPFFYAKNLLAIKFLRSYEDVDMELYRNGPIYVGSLVFEMIVPFFHRNLEELMRYKMHISTNVIEFSTI